MRLQQRPRAAEEARAGRGGEAEQLGRGALERAPAGDGDAVGARREGRREDVGRVRRAGDGDGRDGGVGRRGRVSASIVTS